MQKIWILFREQRLDFEILAAFSSFFCRIKRTAQGGYWVKRQKQNLFSKKQTTSPCGQGWNKPGFKKKPAQWVFFFIYLADPYPNVMDPQSCLQVQILLILIGTIMSPLHLNLILAVSPNKNMYLMDALRWGI